MPRHADSYDDRARCPAVLRAVYAAALMLFSPSPDAAGALCRVVECQRGAYSLRAMMPLSLLPYAQTHDYAIFATRFLFF